jgi:hypothetical protein
MEIEIQMNTTTLFVELLIIGFQTCFWLSFLISLAIEDHHFNWLVQLANDFGNQSLLVAVAVFGIAYTLGVAVDKVAHFLVDLKLLEYFKGRFESFRRWLEANEDLEQDSNPRMMYAQIMSNTADMTGDVLYARSKVRILRASILNFLLITLTAAAFLAVNDVRVPWLNDVRISWLVLVAGLLSTLLFALTYLFTIHLYNLRLRRFKYYLQGQKDADAPEMPDENKQQ